MASNDWEQLNTEHKKLGVYVHFEYNSNQRFIPNNRMTCSPIIFNKINKKNKLIIYIRSIFYGYDIVTNKWNKYNSFLSNGSMSSHRNSFAFYKKKIYMYNRRGILTIINLHQPKITHLTKLFQARNVKSIVIEGCLNLFAITRDNGEFIHGIFYQSEKKFQIMSRYDGIMMNSFSIEYIKHKSTVLLIPGSRGKSPLFMYDLFTHQYTKLKSFISFNMRTPTSCITKDYLYIFIVGDYHSNTIDIYETSSGKLTESVFQTPLDTDYHAIIVDLVDQNLQIIEKYVNKNSEDFVPPEIFSVIAEYYSNEYLFILSQDSEVFYKIEVQKLIQNLSRT